MADVKEEISAFIVQSLREMNYDVDEVTEETDLGPAGLDLESLALAELTVQLEDVYGLKFSDEDVETLATLNLGEFATALAARLAGAAAGRAE
ncbi:acyl carrier protein [Kitasatospora sp. MAA4]|uniref:acyl carrier protein n=1 Tax=Kitasatospora sp. MAA4 TaxID=3035093 RepID=UPI002474A1F4|nr:acyl carrier protein [Kitasatospora sp. MAA4]MDH6131408.1 acyl carrier protein [Kitasatospora sp. MAA4]